MNIILKRSYRIIKISNKTDQILFSQKDRISNEKCKRYINKWKKRKGLNIIRILPGENILNKCIKWLKIHFLIFIN